MSGRSLNHTSSIKETIVHELEKSEPVASFRYDILSERRGNLTHEQLLEVEKTRRSMLTKQRLFDPFQIGTSLVGTVFPRLLRSRLAWSMVAMFITLRVLMAEKVIVRGDNLPDINTSIVSAIGGFMSFFLVFFLSQAYTRFTQQYDVSMKIEGRIFNLSYMAKVALPPAEAWRFVRYINAIHLLGYIGLGTVYTDNNLFKAFNEKHRFLTEKEIARLRKIGMDSGGGAYREVIGWSLEVIYDSFRRSYEPFHPHTNINNHQNAITNTNNHNCSHNNSHNNSHSNSYNSHNNHSYAHPSNINTINTNISNTNHMYNLSNYSNVSNKSTDNTNTNTNTNTIAWDSLPVDEETKAQMKAVYAATLLLQGGNPAAVPIAALPPQPLPYHPYLPHPPCQPPCHNHNNSMFMHPVDINTMQNMVNELLTLRGAVATLYDFADQTIPLAYLHLAMIICFLYLIVITYTIAIYMPVSATSVFPHLLAALLLLINIIFVIGVRELGHQIIDPYSCDLSDLSVMHYVEFTFTASRKILGGHRFLSPGRALEEELEAGRPSCGEAFREPAMYYSSNNIYTDPPSTHSPHGRGYATYLRALENDTIDTVKAALPRTHTVPLSITPTKISTTMSNTALNEMDDNRISVSV